MADKCYGPCGTPIMADEEEQPLEISWRDLSASALDSLIEEFVTRDGTDYGAQPHRRDDAGPDVQEPRGADRARRRRARRGRRQRGGEEVHAEEEEENVLKGGENGEEDEEEGHPDPSKEVREDTGRKANKEAKLWWWEGTHRVLTKLRTGQG